MSTLTPATYKIVWQRIKDPANKSNFEQFDPAKIKHFTVYPELKKNTSMNTILQELAVKLTIVQHSDDTKERNQEKY